ncbi:MAG: hypothetical protein R3C68_06050 [Myxococcota bacterium]
MWLRSVFLTGDFSTVIPVYRNPANLRGQSLYLLDTHIERLMESGQRVGFSLPWSPQDIAEFAAYLGCVAVERAYARITATREQGILNLDLILPRAQAGRHGS